MTARARITPSDLAQAAAVAKAEGVAVTISANGKTFTVAPVDGSSVPAQPSAAKNRAGGNTCDGIFGGRS